MVVRSVYTAQARTPVPPALQNFSEQFLMGLGSLVKHEKFMSALALNLELWTLNFSKQQQTRGG
jgi:hypothetical protein